MTRFEARRLWRWLPHVAIGMLALPFIIRQNAWYEWANPLWQLELQAAHVKAFGTPSYFIHAAGMLFYPEQLFYAGPMLSLLAYPAVVLGAWPVFAFTCAAAFSALSAGVSWTARNLGVDRDLAVLPGLMFAATPYLVSNLYGRGAWAELVAVAGLAVAVGAGTSLALDRARSRPATMAGLAVATAVVAGTHNITLLFGTIFALAFAAAILPWTGTSGGRGSLRAIAGVAIGAALCGGFLLPDVWLSGRTFIAGASYVFIAQLHGFDHLSLLFDPLAGQPAEAHGTFARAQTLVAGTGWSVIALLTTVARRSLDRRWLWTAGTLVLIAVTTTVFIVHPDWWASFPAQVKAIQFPFRLVTFLAFATVLLIAVLLTRSVIAGNRVLVALLGVAVALQLILAVALAVSAQPRPAQSAPVPTAANVRVGTAPAAFALLQQLSYRIVRGHQVPVPKHAASQAPVGVSSPDTVHLFGAQAVGTLVSTEVVNSPLIRISGSATPAAITPDGRIVLRVRRRPWRVTVRPRCSACLSPSGSSPALWLGRWASIAGAVALLALLAAAARGMRRGRMTPPEAAEHPAA